MNHNPTTKISCPQKPIVRFIPLFQQRTMGKKIKLLCNLFVSFVLVENDSDKDHILLKVEATLTGSSQEAKYYSQFDDKELH